jgi:MFS family permease
MPTLRDTWKASLGGLPRTFWTLLAGMLVNRLATFVAVFLSLYLVRDRGLSPAEAGRILAFFGVGILVAGPVGGTLADAIGRRATMLLSLVSGAFAVGAIGFLREPWLLALFAFLASATSELYRPAMNAAIADLVPPPDRARAFGLVYWAVNLGWALSLSVAGLVAERSFLVLFLADAGTCVLFALIVFLKVPETRPPGLHAHSPLSGLARVLADRTFVVFLGLYLTALVVFLQFQLAAALDMASHGLGPAVFSALMAVNGLGVVLLQPALGPWLRRFDGNRLLATSALLFGVGFGVNALADVAPLPAYLAGVVLWTLGEVVGFPVAAALVADLAPVELRGRYQGLFSLSWGVSFTLAPLVGGEVLSRFGARTLWLGCVIVGALVALGYLATAEPRRRRLALLQEEGEITRRSAAPPGGASAASAP